MGESNQLKSNWTICVGLLKEEIEKSDWSIVAARQLSRQCKSINAQSVNIQTSDLSNTLLEAILDLS